jgi:phosphate butyryltransferase
LTENSGGFKMYCNFSELIEQASKKTPRKVAVVMAEDTEVIEACKIAFEKGIITPVFIGNSEKIKISGGDFEGSEIIHCDSEEQAASKAVELASSDSVHMLMKGKVKTSTFLKAIVNKEKGLTGGNILSHILVFEKENRLRIVTDGGMITYPDISQKIKITENAVKVMRSLGVKTPKVAPICAVETVNTAMQATIDAAELSKMADRKQIKDCIIDGPLALDNAVSVEAAEHKGIYSDVAGKADILLMPDIEAGNIFGKSLIYFAACESGGIIAGAKVPVIMLSRADNRKTKLNSIALAMICSQEG